LRHEHDEGEPSPPIEEPSDPPPEWSPLPPLPILPAGAIRWYGRSIVEKLLHWFWGAVHVSEGAPCWVANAQLYIDFGLVTGEIGPVKCDGWVDGSTVPLHGLLQIGFKERVRCFARVLKETLRHAGTAVVTADKRPHSQMIAMFASCWALPWPQDTVDWMPQTGGYIALGLRRSAAKVVSWTDCPSLGGSDAFRGEQHCLRQLRQCACETGEIGGFENSDIK